jgi:integrase
MASTVIRLTDLSVKALPVPERGQVNYEDEGSPLRVRVSQGGTRTFFVVIGAGRRHTIGTYPVVTLAQAREAAIRIKAEKTLGKLFPERISLQDAIHQYLAQADIRPKTREYYERHLKTLKGPKLTDVAPQAASKILDKLPAATRTQALATFRAFFNWCFKRDYIDRSPVAKYEAPKAKSRKRVLTDGELIAIWNATEEPTTFNIIVRLLMLTGQRRNEIAAFRRTWIVRETVTFPDWAVKNGHGHELPVCTMAAELLQKQARETNDAMLFLARGRTDKIFSGWSKSKEALDRACGVNGWTLHDLRRTFATRLAEMGVEPHIIERILNHVSGSLSPIALVYNRARYFAQMRAAVDRWQAHIESLIQLHEAQEVADGGKVGKAA